MIEVELQRGIPLEPRPFAAMARRLGTSEAKVLDMIASLRAEGKVRRFGAVFDARRMGWKSVLCAVKCPPGAIAELAAKVTPLDGVTHSYERLANGHPEFPDLWFTLAAPEAEFDGRFAEVERLLAPSMVRALPATVRYKVDVVFGADVRVREESVDPGAPLSEEDLAIVRALEGDTETRSDYFAAIASSLGISEWKLLATLEMWRRSGRFKRLGMLLNHRDAGWTHNAMCCWRVPEGVRDFGRALAASPHVTHCYERPAVPEFPYNLFAMIHCRSLDEAKSEFADLESALQLPGGPAIAPGVMLLSRTEFKKTSLRF